MRGGPQPSVTRPVSGAAVTIRVGNDRLNQTWAVEDMAALVDVASFVKGPTGI